MDKLIGGIYKRIDAEGVAVSPEGKAKKVLVLNQVANLALVSLDDLAFCVRDSTLLVDADFASFPCEDEPIVG